jgi:NTP pyrophosphatase (non-canonical NTP hydrolase)
MTYYLYHIPGKKIGVTRDVKYRVEQQQGYGPDEYDIIMKSDNIKYISEQELYLQKFHGYRVDEVPYNKLKCNKMKINVTEQTTTFPCPVNKLKGQLMDNIGLRWETEHGDCAITNKSVDWIMLNAKESMYNKNRCYIYNKAFSRYFENNDVHELAHLHWRDQYNGKTKTGALYPTGVRQEKCVDCNCEKQSRFDLIREWAEQRGLYDKGDPKTQALKLVEEVGETSRAILKGNHEDIIDGIGDCVVVLTNLAELVNTPIEECTARAYNEIKNRKGKMDNGTFKKDE